MINTTEEEIYPEVLATIEDGKEGSGNEELSDHEEQSEYDIEYLSDPDLDDIPKDIDDEGPIEGEDVHPHSTENIGPGIVIRNNPRAFMTDVDLDVALAR
ncbi:hypothetical protein PVK06_004925 [Gossypium arboreum]|uniref:Uncharacterized protein n=1 Tax=Gossypium arboreum TaxID=29729 RepID=A0ABR0QUB3_GOSAR|nr:hypothetical protein PVK06_004925 [Gossypium arboreum]